MADSVAWVTQVVAAQGSVHALLYAYKHKRAKHLPLNMPNLPEIDRIPIQILI